MGIFRVRYNEPAVNPTPAQLSIGFSSGGVHTSSNNKKQWMEFTGKLSDWPRAIPSKTAIRELAVVTKTGLKEHNTYSTRQVGKLQHFRQRVERYLSFVSYVRVHKPSYFGTYPVSYWEHPCR
jgi:hypothetical protein